MRKPMLPLLVAPLLLLAAAAAAEPLLTDPEGDVEVLAAATPVPAGDWEAVDLLDLSLVEDPRAFHFAVQVVDVAGRAADLREDAPFIMIHLAHGETGYMVGVGRSIDAGFAWGGLHRMDPGSGGYRWVKALDVGLDTAEATFSVSVDRHDLLDHRGAPPGRGRAFEDVHVVSRAQLSGLSVIDPVTQEVIQPVTVMDRMPDEGSASYEIRLGGGLRDGDLSLASPDPYRASNGGAALYRFPVLLSNDGGATAALLLAEGVPSNWNVSLAAQRVDLEAGETVQFDVWLQTPFAHRHGGSESFVVHVASEDGASHATLELGVHYLEVPQPTGHHSTLWFHSQAWDHNFRDINPLLGGNNGRLLLNALQEDPADEGTPIQGSSWGIPTSEYRWYVCLEPQLRMGIDLDLSRDGLLQGTISTTRPLDGAVLRGQVVHLGPGPQMHSCFPGAWQGREQTVVAVIEPSQPQDLPLDGRGVFEGVLTPQQAADHIPYERDAALVVELILTSDSPGAMGGGGPAFHPGSSLDLPLNEYRDTRPAGTIGTEEDEAPEPVVEAAPEEDTRSSPGPAAVLLAAGLAALARRRR